MADKMSRAAEEGEGPKGRDWGAGPAIPRFAPGVVYKDYAALTLSLSKGAGMSGKELRTIP